MIWIYSHNSHINISRNSRESTTWQCKGQYIFTDVGDKLKPVMNVAVSNTSQLQSIYLLNLIQSDTCICSSASVTIWMTITLSIECFMLTYSNYSTFFRFNCVMTIVLINENQLINQINCHSQTPLHPRPTHILLSIQNNWQIIHTSRTCSLECSSKRTPPTCHSFLILTSTNLNIQHLLIIYSARGWWSNYGTSCTLKPFQSVNFWS